MIFSESFNETVERQMVGGALGGLVALGELHRVRRAPGRVRVLGDLGDLPSIGQQAPEPLELRIVTPTRHVVEPPVIDSCMRVVGRKPTPNYLQNQHAANLNIQSIAKGGRG